MEYPKPNHGAALPVRPCGDGGDADLLSRTFDDSRGGFSGKFTVPVLMGTLIACGLAALALLWLATPACAQMPMQLAPCAQASQMSASLLAKYGEIPVAIGVQHSGYLMQTYASSKTGTWTIVSTSPQGVSCIMAAGGGWESMPEPVEDAGT